MTAILQFPPLRLSPPPIRAANGGEGSGVGGSFQILQTSTPRPGALRAPTLPAASLGEGKR
jgi:hypothetical protein